MSSLRHATLPVVLTLATGALFGLVLWHCTPEPAPDVPPAPVVVLPPPEPQETAEQIRARKLAFINLLLPIIQAENRRLLDDRERLDRVEQVVLHSDELISEEDFAWIKHLADGYDLDPAARQDAEFFRALRKRVDIVPASLIVAQAAIESGWGRSEVTREANNFFGHYCYGRDCGVPAPGAGDLRRFASPADSVHAYMRNLNTHPAYKKLRNHREQLRARSGRITGTALATVLGAYSERGEAYVADVQALIRDNDLEALPNI